jgi:signal transduction histidine kinase
MDKGDKIAFHRANGQPFYEYGNIKLFRDNFRILPYGDKENDWLGIDLAHSQAVFRTFGTRDIIGYVQITRELNPALKDATNRQGLNEDTPEFEAFKAYIGACLKRLTTFIFDKIKEEGIRQGRVIEHSVNDLRYDLSNFNKRLSDLREGFGGNFTEKQKVLFNDALIVAKSLEDNIENVGRANKQREEQLVKISNIVKSEIWLYDSIHSVKNKLPSLKSLLKNAFDKHGIPKEDEERRKVELYLKDVTDIVTETLNRAEPDRNNPEPIILSEMITTYSMTARLVYPGVQILLEDLSPLRVRCQLAGLKIMMDNLFSNSIKALMEREPKMISISLLRKDNKAVMLFCDNGPGVPDEAIPFIFQPLYGTTSGTGMGLFSVADFLAGHNGGIEYLKNSGIGGATFKVTIPLI